jgi:hypothetical protein
MWANLLEKIAEIPLSAWYGALTCLAISLPVLGGFCGFAAWRIGGRIADLKETANRAVVEQLNASLEVTHEKLDGAREVAHQARHFSAFLQEKQAAWTLTHEQKERFIAFLEKAPKGRVAVEYVASDGKRSRDFAAEIQSILGGAGYTVWKSLQVYQDTHSPVIGVQVQIKTINPLSLETPSSRRSS